MRNTWLKNLGEAIGAGLLMALLIGCNSNAHQPLAAHGDEFSPEDDTRSVVRLADIQAAAGARHDATLQPHHFSGKSLNSLGEAKLDAMLRDEEPADPLTVYLNLKADDARTEARKASVTTYLASTGLKPEQIALELGRNPDATGSAQAGLTNVKKTETGSGATAEGAMIIAPSIDPAAVTE